MKKLGIFAIGTLFFLAVSCDKNKTSLAPSSPASNTTTETMKPKPEGVRNDLVDPIIYTSKFGKDPGRGVRNDENINGNTGTERTDRSKPVRKDMNTPYNDPRRYTRLHIRNDMQNPNNDPR